jgi:hypothetical protein
LHPLVEIVLTTGDAADALEQVQNQSVRLKSQVSGTFDGCSLRAEFTS